jgi:hypothetical protein
MRKEQLTGSQLGTDLPSEGLVGQLGNYGLFSLERREDLARCHGAGRPEAPTSAARRKARELYHTRQSYAFKQDPCAFWDSEEVRTLRESAGMTQVEMAELLKLLGLTTARSKHKNG